MSYFKDSNYIIFDNDKLRKPQVHGYFQILNHFENDDSNEHAIVILPTGIGKTTLMAMCPFGIADEKVLIIAPQLIIRNTILDALDPSNPNNVYRKYGILSKETPLPYLYSYDTTRSNRAQMDLLDQANIVVLNAQKLQQRLESSPLNFLPSNYFDMIIVDESHHAEAITWKDTLQHFNKAKVVKVTATNFRTDGVNTTGKVVFKYSLAAAMHENYVKSLEQCKYEPEVLHLTLADHPGKVYTVDQIYELGIGDDDFVSRSVAYSYECNKVIAQNSFDSLNELKKLTDVPHKILAIACSIKHANEVASVYAEIGAKVAVVHSQLEKTEIDRIFNDIENDRLDVIVNVNMLGEGYDHKYLTIGAIFRPFKNMLPYLQFVGRLLRRIPNEEVKCLEDNIAKLFTHHHLGLDELWDYFKKVGEDVEIIKGITDTLPTIIGGSDHEVVPRDSDIANATDSGNGSISSDAFLNTQLLMDRKREEDERERLILELSKILGSNREQAERIIENNRKPNNEKRLDQLYTEGKKELDFRIRYQMVPDLINMIKLDPKGKELNNSSYFKGKYAYLTKYNNSNDALLAIFLNTYLSKEIGLNRDQWTLKDYHNASNKLNVKFDHMCEQLMIEYNIS